MPRGKQPETPPDPLAKIQTVNVGPSKDGKASRDEVPTLTIPELAPYGPLQMTFSEIESWKKGSGGDPIREAVYTYYITEGVELGKMPDNPRGTDGNNRVNATLVLRGKDDRSKLDPDVVARFDDLQIRLGVKEYAPNTLRMKPAIWQKHGTVLLGKLLQICNAVPEVVDCLRQYGYEHLEDIFEIQVDEHAYRCVGPNTIDDIFFRAREAREKYEAEKATGRIPNQHPFTDDAIRELLQIVCATPTITIRQYYGDLSEALVETRKQLCPTPEDIQEAKREAEAAAKAAAKAKNTPDNGKAKPAQKRTVKPETPSMPVGAFAGQTGRNAARLGARSRRR